MVSTPRPKPGPIARTVRLYPWYVALFNALFWMPVFFLYFSAHLSLDHVFLLEAVYYFAVVILEVPSGYFSDRVGRRVTLAISALSLMAAYTVFATTSSFLPFAFAQVLLATGISFNSGTDTALHYDALQTLGREHEYANREAVAARAMFAAGAAAAIVGGAAATIDMRLAYLLSLAGAAGLLALVASFGGPADAREADAREGDDPPPSALGFLPQLRATVAQLRDPALAWLFAFAVAMIAIVHIPYELYQPYLGLLGDRGALGALDRIAAWLAPGAATNAAPLAAGLHAAVTMAIGAWIAGRSIRVRDAVGTGRTLLLALGIQVAMIALMGLWLSPIVITLVLLRGASRGLVQAPLNAAVSPRIPSAQRATYLSLQSLAGRLAFGLVLVSLSLAAGEGAPATWPVLSGLLRTWAIVGAAVMVVLAIALRGVAVDGPSARAERPVPRD